MPVEQLTNLPKNGCALCFIGMRIFSACEPPIRRDFEDLHYIRKSAPLRSQVTFLWDESDFYLVFEMLCLIKYLVNAAVIKSPFKAIAMKT